MMCRSCNRESHHIRTIIEGSQIFDLCHHSDCGDLSEIDGGIPDVYLGRVGEKFENLCDDKGRSYEITSKRQKKQIMDRLGVSEAGDRVNGAPYGSKTWIEGTREWRKKQFDKDRPVIRETYRQWRERAGR